jgi:hypothetical protein
MNDWGQRARADWDVHYTLYIVYFRLFPWVEAVGG